MRSVFQCEKCKALFLKAEEASHCELAHKDPVFVKGLKWCQRPENVAFPSEVFIRVDLGSAVEFDYAVYTLSRIGPRGV